MLSKYILAIINVKNKHKKAKERKNKKKRKRGEKRVKEREKEIFTNRGITLVALIITIIVLLILAGVSLSFVFNGGILDKAQQAVDKYQNESEKEQDILDKIDKYLENELGGGSGGGTDIPEEPDDTDVPAVDGNGLAKEDTTITTDDPNVQIVIPKGFAPVILQTGRTDSMPGENGAVKEIMPKEDWNSITKEQINKGIVVVDNKITYDNGQTSGTVPDFNEYVWVPMTDSSKFKRVAWNGLYYDGSDWGYGTHPIADVSTSNKFWEETESSEYTDMVDSVSRNKGFYISRYEASNNGSDIAQSKRGQEPWTGVTQLEAKTESRNMKPSINSHLIYGIEWDSVLKWAIDSQAIIGSESGGTKTITEDDVQSGSRSWGNYANSTGGAADNSYELQPGGTNEYWKVNNIYDLAGNAEEWTQEKYSTGTYRAIRGGSCDDIFSDTAPAAFRFSSDEFYPYYIEACGFRVGFYV